MLSADGDAYEFVTGPITSTKGITWSVLLSLQACSFVDQSNPSYPLGLGNLRKERVKR